MKKNSELPKLKLSTDLKSKIDNAMKIINGNDSELIILLPEFRRMALKHFSESIAKEGLTITFKPA